MEHADEDNDEGSTHAILISDLRETKPQGKREALEKDKVSLQPFYHPISLSRLPT